jgi:3-phenylpropionate/trans-cinnamate dioxygenase ferredoxin subunit
MAFVKVIKTGDVPPGTTKVCEVADRCLAICNVNGEFYAIDDICTHDDAPLDQGDLDGYEIECPRHGARFDIRTGAVTDLPAVIPIDTFPVRISGDDVEVDL